MLAIVYQSQKSRDRERERKKSDEVQESEIHIANLAKTVKKGSTQSSRMLYFQLDCSYPVHVTDKVTVVLHGFTVVWQLYNISSTIIINISNISSQLIDPRLVN